MVIHSYCNDKLVNGKGSRRCLMVKRALVNTSRWENLGKCLDLAKREIRRSRKVDVRTCVFQGT